MKKALVLGLLLSIAGFGAAAQLSGSWDGSIYMDLCDVCDTCIELGSTLEIDYACADWTFAAISTLDDTGFAGQKFTAAGSLGAFNFSAWMTFDPFGVTKYTYPDLSGTFTQTPEGTYFCTDWIPTETWSPKFLKFQASGSVTIAGVNLGLLFLIDQSNWIVTYANYALMLNSTQTDSVVLPSYQNGVGYKLTLGGSFGCADLTSYTYFGMTEADARTTFCPTIGKRGVYTLAGGCVAGFAEEYLMLKGISFGCISVDAALKIACTGFSSFKIVIADIAIGGWGLLDVGINFTTTSKALDLCFSLVPLAFDCFTVELGFGNSGFGESSGGPITLGDITVHGFGFAWQFGSVTFSSYTELDKYSMLFSPGLQGAYGIGYADWEYLYGCTVDDYLIPWSGISAYTAAAEGDCCGDPDTDCVAQYVLVSDGFYEAVCVDLVRYRLWEMFELTVDQDSCCGGMFGLDFVTYFGNREELAWVAYDSVTVAGTVSATTWLLGSDTYASEFTKLTAADADDCVDVVNWDYGYKSATGSQLFNWAYSTIEVTVGIGSNIDVVLGAGVSVFGYEYLEFGFEVTF